MNSLPTQNLLPTALLKSLREVPGFSETGFCEVHKQAKPPVSVRLHPQKVSQKGLSFPLGEGIPWCTQGYYLNQRPLFTLDPLLHAGAYYVQEASSMFIEQALLATGLQAQPVVCIDLCAAPGGKSTHLQALLHPESVLIANEVISPRNSILVENLTKWSGANILVTQNDPGDLGRCGPLAHIMLVDAPCSGSGLFRRQPQAIEEWSEQAVALCSQRQQRILADALPCLLPGGWLIYATCSYSPAENEDMVDWLCSTYGFISHAIPGSHKVPGIVPVSTRQVQATAYRFFPHLIQGEGFFLALLQKPENHAESRPAKKGLVNKAVASPLPKPIAHWLDTKVELDSILIDRRIHAGSPALVQVWHHLQKKLYFKKAGVAMAEIAHKEYLPMHELALSGWINTAHFSTVELPLEDALHFLQRQPVSLPPVENGWVLVTFKGYGLGWIKQMGNRYNNYYPKNWRIRMDIPAELL